MINLKGFRMTRLWPNFKVLYRYSQGKTEESHEISVRIAGLWAETSSRDLPNTKQER
jgi:hypothetical protein